MVKPIMRDIFFLNQPSEPATESDRKTGMDLLDTLKAHEEECWYGGEYDRGTEKYHCRAYGIYECFDV